LRRSEVSDSLSRGRQELGPPSANIGAQRGVALRAVHVHALAMEQRILSVLAEKDYVPLSAENLQRHLRVAPDREPEFTRALRKLERDGKIACIKASRYVLASDADLIPGRIRMNRAGKGFLAPDDSSLPEIAIAESATGTALHEDRAHPGTDAHQNCRHAAAGARVVFRHAG